MGILALVFIIGAVICFGVETIRSGFSLTNLGLFFLALYLGITHTPLS